MYTIGQLAKQSGLSRSTLLYYDSIGLFSPSGRSRSNYRTYTEAGPGPPGADLHVPQDRPVPERHHRIMKTRGKRGVLPLLEKRLDELNKEIRALRSQQHFIVKLFKSDRALSRIRVMDKESWIRLLQSRGGGPGGTGQMARGIRTAGSGCSPGFSRIARHSGKGSIAHQEVLRQGTGWRENERTTGKY